MAARFAFRVVIGSGLCALLSAAPGSSVLQVSASSDKEVKRPALSVKVTPNVSFSPARVTALAELKGGPNDYEDYYCAGVEWDWGDGTTSASTTDCEPYEAGKSEIKRRFSKQHDYRHAGNYRVQVRLMRKTKALVSAGATVQVRPGVNDRMF
jgi:hypothetical protein